MESNDTGAAIAALLHIYAAQTEDEKMSRNTAHRNGIGFSMTDAKICSSIAQQYIRTNSLSDKQIEFVKKIIPKYANQLPDTLTPVLIKKKEPAKQFFAATSDGDKISVKFSYNENLIANIKTIRGRRWDSNSKSWSIPNNADNIQALKCWGCDMDGSIKEPYSSGRETFTPKEVTEVQGLKSDLYPFQLEGVNFIESKSGRAIVGDEMGLGKTAQALAWLTLHPELRPAVIICPASLKLNWSKEINKWMGIQKCRILSGKTDFYLPPGDDIIIANYDVMPNDTDKVRYVDPKTGKMKTKKKDIPGTGWVDHIPKISPKVLILDECHYLKNSKSLRTKAISRMAKGIQHIIALSGTLITNRPAEAYSIIQMIKPSLFPKWFDFARRYCDLKHNGFGWDYSGASNTKELNKILKENLMVRRLKESVLTDLPAKVRTVIPLEVTNRSVYDRAENNFINWLASFDTSKAERAQKAEQLVRIEALKQLVWKGKKDAVIEWITDFLECGQKLVVFAVHTEILNYIYDKFAGISVKLSGSTSKTERQNVVDRFQTDDSIRLFIGGLKPAGVGITLTSASATCTVDFGWTPGDHLQAEDRTHRIGQEADSVNAFYLAGFNTIDIDIIELIEKKSKVLDQILDGKDVEAGGIFNELLTKLKERKS